MSRRNRNILILFVSVALLVSVVYIAAGTVIYNRLSSVQAHCEELRTEESANTPNTFNALRSDVSVDAAPFYMSTFEDVAFPSRDDNVSISGWYVEAGENDAPAVILVHGLNGCKRASAVLLAAGMLNKAGFNILMIDLRDHGDSAIEDGRFAGGTEEYRDVLGAWDWLVDEKQIEPARIGLFGTSLGAASVLNAMAIEPRAAAVWEDSSFAEVQVAIEDFLAYNGLPTFFAPAGPLVGRVLSGDDLTALSPIESVSQLNGRPLFIVHGDADALMPVKHAYVLAEAANVEPWIAAGSEHVGAMFNYTEEYERRLVEFFNESLQGR